MEILRKAFGDDCEQIECASWVEGPLMVLAGPGSGKTSVLTHRIGYLLRLHPRGSFRILALTFTNKAAEEMRGRLRQIPGYVRARVWAGTFHGFCTSLLRQYSCYIGIARSFTTIDGEDQEEMLTSVQESSNLPRAKLEDIRRHVSRAKSQLKTPEEYGTMLESAGRSPVPALYYGQYEKRMRAFNLLDYDDLIWWTIRLLGEVEAVRTIVQDAYRFVLVDECQDTTLAQHEFVGLLAPHKEPNLFAVADENQSIFEWNNARIQNLADMIKRYGMEVKNLSRSYRCPPEVLRLANRIMLKADRRVVQRRGELVSQKRQSPGCVAIQICEDDDEEAERVLDIVLTGPKEGHSPGEFAIIGRTRFAFKAIEAALSDAGIPHVIVGDVEFARSPEVSACLCALRLLLNPDDAQSLRQLVGYVHPSSAGTVATAIELSAGAGEPLSEAIERLEELGVPPETAQRVQQLYRGLRRRDAAQLDALTALGVVEEVLGLSPSSDPRGGADRHDTENLQLLREMAKQFRREAEDQRLPAFVGRLSLERRGDVFRDVEQDPDHVRLLTVHAAKGTEHPVVVMVALEEGIFPHYLSIEGGTVDEERRSCFVAMTRTEERLVLSLAKQRKDRRGRPWGKEPSRFVQEIAADLGVDLDDQLV